mgnify:CR=1 FL=1
MSTQSAIELDKRLTVAEHDGAVRAKELAHSARARHKVVAAQCGVAQDPTVENLDACGRDREERDEARERVQHGRQPRRAQARAHASQDELERLKQCEQERRCDRRAE